ncbi:nose resistant to fluoxetine protein 6-like [Glandiceps talaboti]
MARFGVSPLWILVSAFFLTTRIQAQNVMDTVFEELVKSLNPTIPHPYKNVTEKCYDNTLKYMGDLVGAKTYARKMYYSSGAFRQDYDLTRNLQDLGDIQMCGSVEPEVNETEFGATYCGTSAFLGASFNLGTCFPDSCTNNDVHIYIYQVYLRLPNVPPIFELYVDCVETIPLRTSDIVAITLCSILLAIIVVGTIYDIILRCRRPSSESIDMPVAPKYSTIDNGTDTAMTSQADLVVEVPEETSRSAKCAAKCKEIISGGFRSFSIIVSSDKILSTRQGSRAIGCLNGIRVLSMFWIILYHVWLFLVTVRIPTTFIENPRYVDEEVYGRFVTLGLWRGDLGVEAFLVLSGLLVSYITLRQLQKCSGPRHYNWVLFYFHRYWRLTPAYAFVLMFYTTLVLHIGRGIFTSLWYPAQAVCQDNWWANMLYIHNLYPFPGFTAECMGWSWYLSLDMQLFILSPIFIITFYKSWKAGTCLSIVVSLASFATSAYLATVQGMTIGSGQKGYGEAKYEPAGGDWLYSKPYYRIPEYILGIALGYVIFRLNGKQVKINKCLNVFMWNVALLIAGAVVYGQFGIDVNYQIPQGVAVFYITMNRFGFSLTVAWVIFACSTGNGGPVQSFLSSSYWKPLAQLNYCAYLVHLMIIFMFTFGLKSLWFYTDINFALIYIALLVTSYGIAFIVSMAVEMPMIELEKVILPGRKKKSQ